MNGSTNFDIATWGCIVIANVHAAADNQFPAIVWIVLSLVCMLLNRRFR